MLGSCGFVGLSLLVEVWLNTAATRPVDREGEAGSFGGGRHMHDGHGGKHRWSSKQMQPPDWVTSGLFGQSIRWSLAGLRAYNWALVCL